MASKNVTQVLIGGKIYTLSGYESEEYLQRVAGYLNNKVTEIKTVSGYQRMNPDMRSLMLNLNVADDYFKLKKQADQLNDQIAAKDRELYEIKHELIQTQMRLEGITAQLAHYQDANPADVHSVSDSWSLSADEEYAEEVSAGPEEITDNGEVEELYALDAAPELVEELPDSEEDSLAELEEAAGKTDGSTAAMTPESMLSPLTASIDATPKKAGNKGIPVPPSYTGSRRGKTGKNHSRR